MVDIKIQNCEWTFHIQKGLHKLGFKIKCFGERKREDLTSGAMQF